jgi:DNA-binding winged helix-turn-helix (wHTH) protein
MTQFGSYRFDDVTRVLYLGDRELPLTRKARDVLACLLAARGKWVSKEEILDAVWRGTNVHPDNVKVLIHEVRAVLQDDARDPRFVRSESGRGYLFVAEVVDEIFAADDFDRRPILTGRNQQLAVLADALDDVRAGAGRVIVIDGERGSGKTAICGAFVRVARASTMLRTVSASCRAEPPDVPLGVFKSALGCLACPPFALSAQRLAIHAPLWNHPLLSEHDGVRPDGARDQALDHSTAAEQLPAALEVLSDDLPLVLVIEDVQCADAASLALIERLSDANHPGRWLLVATVCAADQPARSARLWTADPGGGRPSRVVSLNRLTVADIGRYLDTRFGPACLPTIAPLLHQLGGGSPFVTVAAADGLVESGAVQRHGHEWRVHVDPPVLESLLPDLLRPAISTLRSWLTTEQRRVVEAACAVGLEFSDAQVALACDEDPALVRRVLDGLAARGLIVIARGGGRALAARYSFRHAVYAYALAAEAPMMEQIRAAQRLARPGEREAPARSA